MALEAEQGLEGIWAGDNHRTVSRARDGPGLEGLDAQHRPSVGAKAPKLLPAKRVQVHETAVIEPRDERVCRTPQDTFH